MAKFPSRLPKKKGASPDAASNLPQPQIADTTTEPLPEDQLAPQIAKQDVPPPETPRAATPTENKADVPNFSFQRKPAQPAPAVEEDLLDEFLDNPLGTEKATAPPSIPTQPAQEVAPMPEQSIPATEPPAPKVPSVETIVSKEEQSIQQQETELLAINQLSAPLKQSILKLMELITDDISTEVTLNGPTKVGVKQNGQRYIYNDIDLGDIDTYHAIINSFILPYVNTGDRIGVKNNLIEGQLSIPDTTGKGMPPQIARVTVLLPPTVKYANVTIAKKAKVSFTIDDLISKGTMTNDMGELLKKLAKGRATVIVSGATGAGKTTFLEALSHEFDTNDRIVLVEDIPELDLAVNDLVPLKSRPLTPGDLPNTEVTLEWLVKQANRIRPDRIIVGEIRGGEMLEFLIAANSGMDGSMTTIHADTPQKAIAKMVSLAGFSNNNKSEVSLLKDIASSVHVIVQLDKINGRHVLSQIEEVSNTVSNTSLGVQTAPLYRFDRNTEKFVFENRASDELISFLKQRGVDVQNTMSGGTNYLSGRR